MNEIIKRERDMGIYLHIPFCKMKCTYCDFASYQGLQAYYESYVEALIEEIKLWCDTFPESRKRKVTSIYFGGGTPTELSSKQLGQIFAVLSKNFYLVNPEITIEANPGEVDGQYIQELKKIGFNRISFGVQTFNEELLCLLRRGHTAGQARTALWDAEKAGFTNISMDFIYALPGQTTNDLAYDLAQVPNLPVNHVSIYGLQLEEGTYLHKSVQERKVVLPEEDRAEEMYDYMIDTLRGQGFDRYEISNFCKNKTYSRHNLKYWQYNDYLGFGVSAHSFYDNTRRSNLRYVAPYLAALQGGSLPIEETESIFLDRSIEDYSFLGLRTKWGINTEAFRHKFHQDFLTIYHEVVVGLMADKLLRFDDHYQSYVLTDLGAKHGNYVFEKFLRD